jgi:hypothetical protein
MCDPDEDWEDDEDGDDPDGWYYPDVDPDNPDPSDCYM